VADKCPLFWACVPSIFGLTHSHIKPGAKQVLPILRAPSFTLRRELLGVLDKVAKLTAAQAEAFRGGEDSMFDWLEEAVDTALREKQRDFVELRRHCEGHG